MILRKIISGESEFVLEGIVDSDGKESQESDQLLLPHNAQLHSLVHPSGKSLRILFNSRVNGNGDYGRENWLHKTSAPLSDDSLIISSFYYDASTLSFPINYLVSCEQRTSLGGSPPSQTSGTRIGYDGAGGGHGGRGASCFKHNQTSFWVGDVYAWSTLSKPWSYGSRGGGISPELPLGGSGGGRVKLLIKEVLLVNGSVTAEGGYGGSTGGGGSGGSIFVHAIKLDDDKWWRLPIILLLVKSLQARIVDWHIANLEVEDFSLFSSVPDAFWAHESS